MSLELPNVLVEKAVAKKDDGRSYLQSVYLDLAHKGRAALVATDGKILVATPVDRKQADSIGEGLIPAKAIVAARKNGGLLDAQIERPEGTFPKWRRVVPKTTARKYPYDFAVNCDLLKQVQDALCGKTKWPGLELWFAMDDSGMVDPNGAILCRALDDRSGAFGLVMPLRSGFARTFDEPKAKIRA